MKEIMQLQASNQRPAHDGPEYHNKRARHFDKDFVPNASTGSAGAEETRVNNPRVSIDRESPLSEGL